MAPGTGTRLALALTAGALALGGCGGDDPGEIVRETAANLGKLRSGDLDTRLLIEGTGTRGRGNVGFAVKGPFALPARRAGLPNARVTYTRIAGPRRAAVTLAADGRRAAVLQDGAAYLLSGEQARPLRLASGRGAAGGVAPGVGRWLADPSVEDGPSMGGQATQRIRARLRVSAAVNDLLRAAERLAPGAPAPIRGAAAGELDRAARNPRIEILTGKDDRLLRRLTMSVEFPLEEAGAALEGLKGARIEFRLGVERPNQPVRVRLPADPRPYAELPAGG